MVICLYKEIAKWRKMAKQEDIRLKIEKSRGKSWNTAHGINRKLKMSTIRIDKDIKNPRKRKSIERS